MEEGRATVQALTQEVASRDQNRLVPEDSLAPFHRSVVAEVPVP